MVCVADGLVVAGLLAVFLPSFYLIYRAVVGGGLLFSRDWRVMWLVVGVMLVLAGLWFAQVQFDAVRSADALSEAYRVKAELCWGMKRGLNYSAWNLTQPTVIPIDWRGG